MPWPGQARRRTLTGSGPSASLALPFESIKSTVSQPLDLGMEGDRRLWESAVVSWGPLQDVA